MSAPTGSGAVAAPAGRGNYPLDPELRAVAAALPVLDRSDVAATRRVYEERVRAVADAGAEDVPVRDVTVASADGHPLTLRVYTPVRRSGRGAVYHVHGGGFMLGDLRMNHARLIEIAREAGCVVVAVDYRLAPEWPFPTPVGDARTGLDWVRTHADELDIDAERIVLQGQSAGGSLAASVVLQLRDEGAPMPPLLFLACPVLDDRLLTESSVRFTDTPALTRRDLELCWAAYLGGASGDPSVTAGYPAPGRLSAGHAGLAGLPATYIAVAEFDPLRDDGIDFARALLAAGVPTELHLFPGGYHGSIAVRDAAVSRRERDEEIAVLRRATQTPGAPHD